MAIAVPDRTTDVITKFDRALERVRKAPTEAHATAWLQSVYRLGADLKGHADDLVSKMEKGEAWLQANAGPPAHPKWQEREDQWLAWLHEYETVMDALERGKDVL